MLHSKIYIFLKDIKNLIFYKTTENYKSAVVIIIIAATLLIGNNIATFITAYHNINANAQKKAIIISHLGELAIEEPLWNLDDDIIAKIANSLFSDNEVSSVKISSVTGTVMFEKNKDSLASGKNKYQVYSTHDIVKTGVIETGYVVTGQKIGEIKVGITKYYMQLHIIKTFLFGVILNLTTLFLIYLAILAILSQEKNSRNRINSILDNMADSVITTNNDLVIKSCNLATEKMFGFTTSEIIGNKFGQLLLSKDYKEIDENTLKSYSTNLNLNINGSRKNGELFPIEFSVGSIILENEKLFIIVVRDITIRKEVEKTKNEFISTISHELRTPLTAIKGSLALLKSEVLVKLPNEVLKLLVIADNNSSRLVNLINDILDVERIESGKMAFSIETINIISVINEALESNLPYASQFNIDLKFTNDVENIYVLADRQKIIQVLSNLMSNAIKFSHPNEIVEISVKEMNKKVIVSITDKGIGIPAEYKNKLFQKFVQVDSSDTKKRGGTGLGLSICKAIIEQHKGRIYFDSVPNVGSVFYFELPLSNSLSGSKTQKNSLI